VNSSAALATATSTAVVSFSANARRWIGVTFDTDNAGSTTFDFETSTDGVSWSALGSQVVVAGTTDLQTTTTPVTVGNSFDSVGQLDGKAHRAIIRVNGTTQLDADFSTQTADALAFTESSTNAATVTINTTRYTYGIPGAGFIGVTTGTATANIDWLSYMQLTAPTVVDLLAWEVTTAPTSTATVHGAIYAATGDLQPTGSPVATFGPVSVSTSTTGVYAAQITPVTLQPGVYVFGINSSVNFTARLLRYASPAVNTMGATPLLGGVTVSRTNAAFTTATAWNARNTSSTGFNSYAVLRWRPE
jgi:hypothetical protein